MKKLWPPKVEEVKNSKKQTNKHYKRSIPEHPKKYLYVVIKVQR
jgi:hypothetical protein